MTKPYQRCQQQASPDERLALSIEQGVLLWCMRSWVLGMKRGFEMETRIDETLDMLGASEASLHLKGFMFALSHGCTRMIQVRCVCRTQLDVDERALLDVLSLAQAMRPFEALLILRGFVTQDWATAALGNAERVGTALSQAGRFLPEPEQEVRHFAMTQAAPPAHASRETLH